MCSGTSALSAVKIKDSLLTPLAKQKKTYLIYIFKKCQIFDHSFIDTQQAYIPKKILTVSERALCQFYEEIFLWSLVVQGRWIQLLPFQSLHTQRIFQTDLSHLRKTWKSWENYENNLHMHFIFHMFGLCCCAYLLYSRKKR